jgi:HPt (histidine-containing phosphotransfer) domain-containing protein
MNEYISKPVHSAHLIATVTAHLAKADDCNAAFDDTPSTIAEEDTSLAESMLHLFLQLAPERLEAMQSAATRHDMTALATEARKMGQAAERINAQAIAGYARRVQQASTRVEIPAIKHNLLLLETEIARLKRQADIVEVVAK